MLKAVKEKKEEKKKLGYSPALTLITRLLQDRKHLQHERKRHVSIRPISSTQIKAHLDETY